MNRIVILLLLLAFAPACQKKDTVLTPQQEAEYQRMMDESLAKHPPPTYDQLKRENEDLKDREIQRAMEK